MRLNLLPFLFLPGVLPVGYLLGQWPGVGWALAVWGAVVLIGTLMRVRRHVAERKQADRIEPCQRGDSRHPGRMESRIKTAF